MSSHSGTHGRDSGSSSSGSGSGGNSSSDSSSEGSSWAGDTWSQRACLVASVVLLLTAAAAALPVLASSASPHGAMRFRLKPSQPPAPGHNGTRVLLFMMDNRPLLTPEGAPAGYWSVAAALNVQYAAARGYDFTYIKQEAGGSTPCVGQTFKGGCYCYNIYLSRWRGTSWCKVLVMWQLMATLSSRYTHLIYVDSDAVFRRTSIGPEGHFRALDAANATLGVLVDYPWSGAPCTGYLFMRMGRRGMDYMKRWWETDHPPTDLGHAFEQNAMYKLLADDAACRDTTMVLPEWQFAEMSPNQLLFHSVHKNVTELRPFFGVNGWPDDDAALAAVLRGVPVTSMNMMAVSAAVFSYANSTTC